MRSRMTLAVDSAPSAADPRTRSPSTGPPPRTLDRCDQASRGDFVCSPRESCSESPQNPSISVLRLITAVKLYPPLFLLSFDAMTCVEEISSTETVTFNLLGKTLNTVATSARDTFSTTCGQAWTALQACSCQESLTHGSARTTNVRPVFSSALASPGRLRMAPSPETTTGLRGSSPSF